MVRGDKTKYTDKQKRRAEHIEESYEARGVPENEAVKRAWATVNSIDKGGKAAGSGRGQPQDLSASVRGGKLGGPKGGKQGGKVGGAKGGRATAAKAGKKASKKKAAAATKTGTKRTATAKSASAKKTTARRKAAGRKTSTARQR